MSADKTLRPAKWGTARWSRSRWSVFTPVHQKALWTSKRTLYRRVATFHVTRDDTTGWRDPVYTDYAVSGVLVARGQPNMHLPAGVFVRQDAVLITLDGFKVGDQLWDSASNRYYAIIDEPENRFDTQTDGFAYRVVNLKWLPYYAPIHGVGTTIADQGIIVILTGDYHLCVLPNDYEVAQPLAPYNLCVLENDYETVSPDSAYSLCVQANDYEMPSPASEYWFQTLPMGDDFDPVADWTWHVDAGNWSVVAEGATGNCYHEDSGTGESHSHQTIIRPVRVTVEVLVENAVSLSEGFAGIRLHCGGTYIEMRYYPLKYEEALLASDAASGQKNVSVADGSKFVAGDAVTLWASDPVTEVCTVASVAGNTLTMVANLTNTYHTAEAAQCSREYGEAIIWNESSELLRKASGWAADAYVTLQIDLYRGSVSDAYAGSLKAYVEGAQLILLAVDHRHTDLGCSMYPFDKVSLVTSNGAIGRFDDLSFTYQTTLEATE